jgi:hypothetical protein
MASPFDPDAVIIAADVSSAVVAGPVSMMPKEWVCPLLGVDPDDFIHDTKVCSLRLRPRSCIITQSAKPCRQGPKPSSHCSCKKANGEIDARPSCMGFYLVMKQHLRDWSRLFTPARNEHRLVLPILSHCVEAVGGPFLPPAMRTESAHFVQNSSRQIPASVKALQQFWLPQARHVTGPKPGYLSAPGALVPLSVLRHC